MLQEYLRGGDQISFMYPRCVLWFLGWIWEISMGFWISFVNLSVKYLLSLVLIGFLILLSTASLNLFVWGRLSTSASLWVPDSHGWIDFWICLWAWCLVLWDVLCSYHGKTSTISCIIITFCLFTAVLIDSSGNLPILRSTMGKVKRVLHCRGSTLPCLGTTFPIESSAIPLRDSTSEQLL